MWRTGAAVCGAQAGNKLWNFVIWFIESWESRLTPMLTTKIPLYPRFCHHIYYFGLMEEERLKLVVWSEQPDTPEYLIIFTDQLIYTWGNFFSQEAPFLSVPPPRLLPLHVLAASLVRLCAIALLKSGGGAKFEKWSRAERMDILLARYILKQSEVWWMALNGWCTAGMEGLFGEAWVREMHLINQRD